MDPLQSTHRTRARSAQYLTSHFHAAPHYLFRAEDQGSLRRRASGSAHSGVITAVIALRRLGARFKTNSGDAEEKMGPPCPGEAEWVGGVAGRARCEEVLRAAGLAGWPELGERVFSASSLALFSVG